MDLEQWIELITQTNNADAINAIDAFISTNPLQAINFCISMINQDDFTFPIYAQCFIAIQRAFSFTNNDAWNESMEDFMNEIHSALLRGLMFEDITVQNAAAKDISLFSSLICNYSGFLPSLKTIMDAKIQDYSLIIKIGVLRAYYEIVENCPVEPDEENKLLFGTLIQFCQQTLAELSKNELDEIEQNIILECMPSFFSKSPDILNDHSNFTLIFQSLDNCLSLHKQIDTNNHIFQCALTACSYVYTNLNEFYEPALQTLITNGLKSVEQSRPCLMFLKEMLTNQISHNLTQYFDLSNKLIEDHFPAFQSILESQNDFDMTPDDNEDSPIMYLIEMLSCVYTIKTEIYFHIVENYFNEHITSKIPNILYACIVYITTILQFNEEKIYPFLIKALSQIKDNISPDYYDSSMQLLLQQSFITISSIIVQFPFSQRYTDFDFSSLLEIPVFFLDQDDEFVKYSFLIIDSFIQSENLVRENEELLHKIESLISTAFNKQERMLNNTYRDAVIRTLSILMSKTYNIQSMKEVSHQIFEIIQTMQSSLNKVDENYQNNVLLIRDLVRILIVIVKRVKHSLEIRSEFEDEIFSSIIKQMINLLKMRDYIMNDDIISLMVYLISILDFKSKEFVSLIFPEMVENLKQKENIPSFASSCKAINTIVKTLNKKLENHYANQIIELLFTSLSEAPPLELISPILKCLASVFKDLPYAISIEYRDSYFDILDFYSSTRFNIDNVFQENYNNDINDFVTDCSHFYGGLCDGISGLIYYILYENQPNDLCTNLYKILHKFFNYSIKRMQKFIDNPDSKLLLKFGNMIHLLAELNNIKNRISPLIYRENVQQLIDFGIKSDDQLIQNMYKPLKERHLF